jgi:hypothetical protein
MWYVCLLSDDDIWKGKLEKYGLFIFLRFFARRVKVCRCTKECICTKDTLTYVIQDFFELFVIILCTGMLLEVFEMFPEIDTVFCSGFFYECSSFFDDNLSLARETLDFYVYL